ncbi:gamma carbonic anhydrase family protein [Pseudomonadota bacterium]
MFHNIVKYKNKKPKINPSACVAEGVFISGDVIVGKNVSIWPNCTLRGDYAGIIIGDNTNLQDNSVVHVGYAKEKYTVNGKNIGYTIIGDNVTIGHGAILHACKIKDNAFVGMGAILMDEVVVESNAMVAAGALVTPGKVVKSGELWGGNPAKLMRKLTKEEIDYFRVSAYNYVKLAKEYLNKAQQK